MLLIGVDHKICLPLNPQYPSAQILRHIRRIAATGIARKRLNFGISMNDIHNGLAHLHPVPCDFAFLVKSVPQSADIFLIVIHALHEIKRLACGLIIFCQRLIEFWHQNRIDTDGICMHFTDLFKPTQIVIFVNGKFSRKSPRLCRSYVDPYSHHVLPSAVFLIYLKFLFMRPERISYAILCAFGLPLL